MLAATVLFSLVLGAPAATDTAPTDTADAATNARGAGGGEVVEVQKTEQDIEDMGFMERRAAFSLNDDLHPSIADDLLPFFLGGLCSTIGGPLWFPLLFLDEQPEGYFDEAALSWLVWAIPLWAGIAIGIIPYVGWVFSVLWCPIALVIAFYLMPVNVANAWDRAAKVNGMKQKGSKKKKSSEWLDRLPKEDAFAAAAPPSMAY